MKRLFELASLLCVVGVLMLGAVGCEKKAEPIKGDTSGGATTPTGDTDTDADKDGDADKDKDGTTGTDTDADKDKDGAGTTDANATDPNASNTTDGTPPANP